MNGPRILIIEDELPMRTVLRDCLEHHGYRIMIASDGASGLEQALKQNPDLILLDIMMPRLDGYALCRELRRLGREMPILILTAKGQVQDRVTGLDSGADDYLVKPFSSEELMARVRALLRRGEHRNSHPTLLKLDDVQIDLERQTASCHGEPLYLSAREYAMIRLLAQANGGPVTREQFLDSVWGYSAFPTTRTVDTHIANLRAKLEQNPETPSWIQTVHGVGYRLADPHPSSEGGGIGFSPGKSIREL